MTLEIVGLRQRPALRQAIFSEAFEACYPDFMRHDPAGLLYFPSPFLDRYLDFVQVALDEGEVVGRGMSIPFAFGIPGRTELPDAGWDEVIRWANDDQAVGRPANAVSALDITLLPRARGQGNSARMLEAMRANARGRGFADLYAPVRPNAKHEEPSMAMGDYIRLGSGDLPRDPWLRTHVRAGGRIVKVAPCSMTIVGTLTQWQAWTGAALQGSGAVIVAGALSPVHVSPAHDHAVYVEPNVWVHHRL